MAATQKINFLTLVSYSLLQTVFRQDVPFRHNTKRHRQTTDRRHSVPKARPIVRSAKNQVQRSADSKYRVETDGRTDATDCFTLPSNAVCNEQSLQTKNVYKRGSACARYDQGRIQHLLAMKFSSVSLTKIRSPRSGSALGDRDMIPDNIFFTNFVKNLARETK